MEVKKILKDIKSVNEILDFTHKSVTIFGSARFDGRNRYCKDARKLANEFAKMDYAVMTGGGGGIMEAANRGAHEINPELSYGLNIFLPFEQSSNKYATKNIQFSAFALRKYALMNKSKIFVIFPGGFGTMDELFELLVLIQVGFKSKCKIYLFDTEFYAPLVEFFKKSFLKYKTISEENLKMFKLCDSVDEIIDDVKLARKKEEI